MSHELPPNVFSEKLCKELTRGIIHDEIGESDWYKSLNPQQAAGFENYAGPLMMREGLETGSAVVQEIAEEPFSPERQLVNDVSLYLKGAVEGELTLNQYYPDEQ